MCVCVCLKINCKVFKKCQSNDIFGPFMFAEINHLWLFVTLSFIPASLTLNFGRWKKPRRKNPFIFFDWQFYLISCDAILWFTLFLLLIIFLFAVKFVMSKRGKPLLSIDGYTFYAQIKKSGDRTRWLCSLHKQCRAVVHTVGNEIVTLKNVHTHTRNWDTKHANR